LFKQWLIGRIFFESMIMLLLVGFLLLGGVALMLLDAAIAQAEDGYEDDSGFHQESHRWIATTPPAEPPVPLWDEMNGAHCSLDLTPTLRPAGNNPFPQHRQ
jgi:hypothetical protein